MTAATSRRCGSGPRWKSMNQKYESNRPLVTRGVKLQPDLRPFSYKESEQNKMGLFECSHGDQTLIFNFVLSKLQDGNLKTILHKKGGFLLIKMHLIPTLFALFKYYYYL